MQRHLIILFLISKSKLFIWHIRVNFKRTIPARVFVRMEPGFLNKKYNSIKTNKYMANRTVNKSSQEDKANTKPCSCMTCAHSMLHRYGSNPVLAACQKKPQPYDAKFPYEVFVASMVWVCPRYAEATSDKWIQPREARIA